MGLKRSLELLSSKYRVRTVLADTGRILGNLLLEKELASELSLLIHPIIVGERTYSIFGNMSKSIKLKLHRKEVFPKGYVWLAYKVKRDSH